MHSIKLLQTTVLIISVVLMVMLVVPLIGYAQVSAPFADEETTSSSRSITNDWLRRTDGGTSLVDLLVIDIEPHKTKRSIIEHFCATTLGQRDSEDKNTTDDGLYTLYRDEETFRFDPRVSAFMYALCVNIDEAGEGIEFATYTYQKKNYADEVFDSISYIQGTSPSRDPVAFGDIIRIEPDKLNTAWGIPPQDALDANDMFDVCNPKTTMQGCQFSVILPQLFETIMTDYTNLKHAAIMGYKRSPGSEGDSLGTDINEAVAQFSISHFGSATDKKVGCDDENFHYLSDTQPSGKSNHCYHPVTNGLVKQNIESVERLVQKTVLINGPEMMKLACDGITDSGDGTSSDPKNTLHGCAISSYGDMPQRSDRQSMYNLYLNEYVRYSMFVNYYVGRQTTEGVYSPLEQGSILYNYRNAQQDGTALAYELSIAKSAMYQSIRLLKNLSTWYPVYIGLEAYKEDVIRYKGQLANLYTPFNQLYHTFRNVQEKE